MIMPDGWKARRIADQSWESASYGFDLVSTRAPGRKPVGVEILMHALGRAERHGDMDGVSYRTRSGLRGIVHWVHYAHDDDWYFAIPVRRTDGAVVVRVLFYEGAKVDQKRFAYALYRSVRFLPAPRPRSQRAKDV